MKKEKKKHRQRVVLRARAESDYKRNARKGSETSPAFGLTCARTPVQVSLQ